MKLEIYDNRKNLLLEGNFKNIKEVKEELKYSGYNKKTVTVYDVYEQKSRTIKL